MGVGVGVGVEVGVGVAVAVAVGVGVGVDVAVGVGLGGGVGVNVAVAVAVGVGVAVAVGVEVGVNVGVGVEVGVALGDAVGVGVGVGAPEMLAHRENSEVSTILPWSSLVAVAVTNVCPVGSANVSGPKLALQFPSVVTIREPGGSGSPRKCSPCGRGWLLLMLDSSHSEFEKNSRRNAVFGTLSKVPETVTKPSSNEAAAITG